MEKKTKSELNIAVLSNFTINGLIKEMRDRCGEVGVNADFYQGGYGQIYQEILSDESGLKKFAPDITFLIFNNHFIFKDAEINMISEKKHRKKYVRERLNDFTKILDFFLENISGILVFSNLKQISYSSYGISEDRIEFSVKDWINYFNEKTKEKAKDNNRLRIYDFNGFFMRYGENNVINDKLRYLGDIYVAPDFLPDLATDLMGYLKPYVSKNRKCIVLDLDNTLWGGIVGEDGFSHIELGSKPPGNTYLEFQKYLLALNKRGIILAINSRNNPSDALEVINDHPNMILREKNFASMKINWDNKLTNLIEISKELNIGPDSMIFIDDDPVNRDLIKKTLPEVLVVDLPEDSSQYVHALKKLNDLNFLEITNEDYNKGEMYYHQRKRHELKSKTSGIDDFLQQLDISVEILKADDFSIPRISQLTKKTNQFNLTTKRYSEEEIHKISNSTCHFIFGFRVKDKFGDNGLVGVYILDIKDKTLFIDTFLLSCRVIGRNIEKVMLKHIVDLASEEGMEKIIGSYIPTQKNLQVKDFYLKNGFSKVDDGTYELRDFRKIKPIKYIKVVDDGKKNQ